MSEPKPKPIKRPEAKRPFQFGLKSLFVVTFACAILCAIAVQFGVYMDCLLVSAIAVVGHRCYCAAIPAGRAAGARLRVSASSW